MELTSEELLRLIAEGEGKSLEFKRGLSPDPKIARTLCAFANTRGGLLVVGVTDRGAIYGVPRPAEIAAKLRELAEHALEPALQVEIRTVRVEDRKVVCCSVPLSPNRPHAVRRADGKSEVVIRAGSSNRSADGATLRAVKDRSNARVHLDPLAKKILAWAEKPARRASRPAVPVTVAEFARAHNVGTQRARHAFVELERAGRLVGHGFGVRRVYSLP